MNQVSAPNQLQSYRHLPHSNYSCTDGSGNVIKKKYLGPVIENFTYHFGLITFPSGASVSLLWLSLSRVLCICEVQCLWSHIQFLVGLGHGDGLPLARHTGALWVRDCQCPGTDSRNSLASSLKFSTGKSHSPPPPQHIGGLRLYLLDQPIPW